MKTYDPFAEVARPSLGVFGGLPSAPPGAVLVVDRVGRPLQVLASHVDRLTPGEARFGRLRTIYQVVVAERQLERDDAYPCQDAGTFRSTLLLTCRVVDPAAVVVRGVHDVAAVIVPRVTETLREICRRFPAERYAEAEAAALAAIREIEAAHRHDPAFQITDVSLRLSLDAEAAAFVAQLKANERTGVLMRSDTDLASAKAEQESELARQRERLLAQQTALQEEFTRARLMLEKERQAQEAELARLRLEQEAALEKASLEFRLEREQLAARSQLALEQERADHYLGMLTRGDYAVLALQLGQDPSSIERVALQLAQRQNTEAHQQLLALQMFLQEDALEAMDITDKAKLLLARLAEGWARGTPRLATSAGAELPELPGVSGATAGPVPRLAAAPSGGSDAAGGTGQAVGGD
ncbi:MAG TPA: hypothetical protein VI248_14445 [Kineosporiaceae bacterium]